MPSWNTHERAACGFLGVSVDAVLIDALPSSFDLPVLLVMVPCQTLQSLTGFAWILWLFSVDFNKPSPPYIIIHWITPYVSSWFKCPLFALLCLQSRRAETLSYPLEGPSLSSAFLARLVSSCSIFYCTLVDQFDGPSCYRQIPHN